jgi:hypothetical protein
MLNIIALCAGALLIVVTFAGFYRSVWRPKPNPNNSSQSDWSMIAGGGNSTDHHGGSDHGGAS